MLMQYKEVDISLLVISSRSKYIFLLYSEKEGQYMLNELTSMRIIRLYGLLSVEIGLLNNMYPPEERKNWETINPTAEKLTTFKNSVEETLAYLQSTTDQLPAYIGWSEDFSKFMQFLANVTQYDIEASDEKFVESTDGIIKDRKMYWEDVCKTMQRLQEGIENRQKMVEKKICRESIFQKLCKGIGVNRKTI